ncbi:hypothetical protein D0809_03930 [Flavobacterium circumlabens]|uniref:Class IIb bacteriocin, lactobin A/cerein 7B family n=1 Tax=Flavobacterium circumlabens TaxID=2133765 RepID=A0A4Y7UIE2_9FLAO|nr:hypothetical protein [Flavobacterium circumlabens]TCN61039.1 hypothetical protein EV142_101622 [Flavobacterium circumlabens]TEB46154.1 hypothetical protein D0809_03930 [Flavobacterium circumlabens]
MELAVMNLEDLNLVELDFQEVQEVRGGALFTFIALGALIIGVGLFSNNNSKKVNGPGGGVSNPPGNSTGYFRGDLLTTGGIF